MSSQWLLSRASTPVIASTETLELPANLFSTGS
jgi:hypothetical protein